MSTDRHTPGPWKNDSMEFSAGWRCIVNLPDGRYVDVADPRNYATTDTDRANASLIAAAPELLEALEAIVSEPDPLLLTCTDDSSPLPISMKVLHKAQSAIKKAKGAL